MSATTQPVEVISGQTFINTNQGVTNITNYTPRISAPKPPALSKPNTRNWSPLLQTAPCLCWSVVRLRTQLARLNWPKS